jgi:hypothetical protein
LRHQLGHKARLRVFFDELARWLREETGYRIGGGFRTTGRMSHVSDKPDSDRSIGDGARLSYGRVKDAVFLMMLKRL